MRPKCCVLRQFMAPVSFSCLGPVLRERMVVTVPGVPGNQVIRGKYGGVWHSEMEGGTVILPATRGSASVKILIRLIN